MKTNFEQLLDSEFSEILSKMEITVPTEVQEKTIPLILEKKDCIAQSQTGTGKTLAYLLPILKTIDMEVVKPQAIILTPTHELAAQVYNVAELIGGSLKTEVKPALIIGGANIKRQLEKLKEKPRIIIGSAGRIMELVRLKKLTTHFVKTIVLDEGDKLINERNVDATNQIIKTTLRDRQLLFFSATINKSVLEEAKGLCKNAEIITVNKDVMLPGNLEHIYFVTELRDKIEMLRKVIHAGKIEKGIIFINNTDNIRDTVSKLRHHNIKASGLYGTSLKNERKQTLDDFRQGRITHLVASDLAARGLDIKDVTHIINLEVTEEPEYYLHRAGRSGRMDKKGTVITLATERELVFIKKYEKKLNINISKKQLYRGEIK